MPWRLREVNYIQKTLTSVLALAALMYWSPTFAVCPPRTAPEINNPKAYMNAYVDALGMLRSARDRSNEIGKAELPGEVIASFETAKQEYDCAESYVLPYEKSSSKGIQVSAQSFRLATTHFIGISNAFRQKFKDLLDGHAEKPSDAAETSGSLMVKGDEAWHFEMNATVVAGLSLIEFDANNKPRLVLTSAERDALVRDLQKRFSVSPDETRNLPGLESSVSVLLDFLTDSKRPTHDNT